MRRRLAFVCLLSACSTGAPIPMGGDDDPGGDDTSPTPDASSDPAADAAPDPDPDAGPGPAALCFEGLGNPELPAPNYDQFGPTVGSHCAGTNHQAISGIERVVVLGDSITEGTPPTFPTEYYREVLGWQLRQQYGLFRPITERAASGALADDRRHPPHQPAPVDVGAAALERGTNLTDVARSSRSASPQG